MPRPRSPRASERGAALLIAVVSIAVLTALAVDLAYETQVRLRIAVNARDALRAEALATSGVTMGRLVLSMQREVDRVANGMCNLQNGTQGPAGPAGPAPAMPCLRLQVWNLVAVADFTAALFGDAGAAPAAAAAPSGAGAGAGAAAVSTVSYGDFTGGFDVRLEDESEKINVQLDDASSAILKSKVEALLGLVCDPKWDPLFDRTDADGQRYSRSDLIVHLRDWVNVDTEASALVASFPGGNCSFEVRPKPFEKSFSDKNMPYDRGRDRYKAKNGRLDSIEELHLVAGVSDAFMAAFQDLFTVYLPRDAGGKVSATDPDKQLSAARGMIEPTAELTLRESMKDIHQRVLLRTQGGLLSITRVEFARVLQEAGLPVRSQVLTPEPNGPDSPVYRIRSSAVAGDVTHAIDAVVSYEDRLLPSWEKEPTQARPVNMLPKLGRLIRWREE